MTPSLAATSPDAQCTPRPLALALGRFGVDPCSNPLSHIQADRTCMLERGQDGLTDPWTIDGTPDTPLASAWANGPYSKPMPWIERLVAHRAPWASLWKLDVTTAWFRLAVSRGAQWAPFARRLAFERAGNCGVANFCSVLIWRDWTVPAAVAEMLVPQGSWTP